MKQHRIVKGLGWSIGICAVSLSVHPQSVLAGTAAFDKSMQPILAQYLKIQTVLADDSTAGVQAAAQAIGKQIKSLKPETVTGEHASRYKALPAKIKAAASAVEQAAGLDGIRDAFKALSKPMAMWGTISKPMDVDVVYCSMAKGSWLQKSGAVRNPYHGKSMLTCGEMVGGHRYSPAK